MKQQKQLKLMCYKVEIVMSTEAWYFLHGTTNGVCNLTYFLSLLSGMSVTEVSKTKRGLGYALHLGQVDGSMLSLAKEWNIGRKSVSRLLEDFSQRGLIRVDSNPITTIIDMVCVKSWMMDGRLTENPTYQQMVKAYEGVRIYLFIRGSTYLPFQRPKNGNLTEKFGKGEKVQGQACPDSAARFVHIRE